MAEKHPLFKTSDGEAIYMAAYEDNLGLWPVPYETLYVPTRFGSTHMIASGPKDGRPLFLLPVGSGTATSWHQNAAALSRSYRIYAVDTIGDMGKSIPTRPRLTREDSGRWLLDVLDELEIEKAFMVGASYGGCLTMNLALHSPHRLAQIVLLSPAGTFKPIRLKFYLLMLPAALFPSKSRLKKAARAMMAKDAPEGDERGLDLMAAGLKHGRMPRMMAPVVFKDSELRKVKVPVLLLSGEEDSCVKARGSHDRAKRLIPHIKADIIPDAGHAIVEHPELVNKRILTFFSQASKVQ